MTGKALVPGRGRKPKPTAVKKRQGNPGKRKLNENELVSERLTIDTPPPDDLNDDGVVMWHFVLKELCPQGIVLKTDLETVANYCIAYQNRKAANADIKRFGGTIETENLKSPRGESNAKTRHQTTPSGHYLSNSLWRITNGNSNHSLSRD